MKMSKKRRNDDVKGPKRDEKLRERRRRRKLPSNTDADAAAAFAPPSLYILR
jgi:hypothetical protein